MQADSTDSILEKKSKKNRRTTISDYLFLAALAIVAGSYVLLLAAMLIANFTFTTPVHLLEALRSPDIQFAAQLTLFTCTVSTLLCLLVAVPLGYLLTRFRFPGRAIADAIPDIPIAMPCMPVGLALLLLWQMPIPIGQSTVSLNDFFPVIYTVAGVILAQFAVACAFATRVMVVGFSQISPRAEYVALTLGCSRAQAFVRIVLPQARRAILAAGALAWARSLGAFGPVMVLGGVIRHHTEVLSSSVFLESNIGNIEGAVAVSAIMIISAIAILILIRLAGIYHLK